MAIMTLSAARAEIKANPHKFYSYVLHRPDGTPFYVGMGKGKRIADHGRDAPDNKRRHRYLIIKKIIRAGGAVGYSVSFFEARDGAAEDEKRLIALYGRLDIGRGPLTNRTDGGEGGSGTVVSAETLARMSKITTRLWTIPEFRTKTLAAQRAPEAIASLSKSVRSAWSAPGYRDKMSAAMREAAKRPERLTQIASARKGKPMTPEYRAKISKANKGRKFTPEHRAKIAEARRRLWADPAYRAAIAERRLIRASSVQSDT